MRLVVALLAGILLTPLWLTSQEQPGRKERLLSIPPLSWAEWTQCGQAPSITPREGKILGGQASAPGRWPWQVSVRRRMKYSRSSVHRHGGALLTGSWVITAAHPVYALYPSALSVAVGVHNLSRVGEPGTQEKHVLKIHVHPDFDPVTFEADVALLELEQPSMDLGGRTGTICLPVHRMKANRTAILSGWGSTRIGGSFSEVLRWVSVPLVNSDECLDSLKSSGFQDNLGEAFLCAGEKDKDACQGDSGGPLAEEWSTGRWQLIGLVSWGIGCGQLPGVHVNVTHYLNWIVNTMDQYD